MNAPIVPRWEWRTFGDDFGPAEGKFAALTPERVQESDEVYVLSTKSDASVKVRDGLMDVKHLEHVNEDGLEQWIPVLKRAVPLDSADIATLFAALGVPGPPTGTVTYDEFLATIEATPALRLTRVHKRRARYTVGGCMSELSTKCGTSEAFQVAAEARAFLAGRGIEVSGEQQTKTRKALDYFSEALKA